MRSKVFVFFVVLLFILPFYSFAGEGSDTIGACKLLPQIRYAYSDNDYDYHDDRDAQRYDMGEFVRHDIYLQVNYGVCDYFDIYALIGAVIIDPVTGRYYEGDGVYTYLKPDYDAGLLWGLGAKGTLYRSDSGFYVGAGIRFTHMQVDGDYYMIFVSARSTKSDFAVVENDLDVEGFTARLNQAISARFAKEKAQASCR